jgi:hypothetical protein
MLQKVEFVLGDFVNGMFQARPGTTVQATYSPVSGRWIYTYTGQPVGPVYVRATAYWRGGPNGGETRYEDAQVTVK